MTKQAAFEPNITWLDDAHKESVLSILYPSNIATSLPCLLKIQRALEFAQLESEFTDGEIIGTGEADFTKRNASYEFTDKERIFQLLDVPGIEGNESKHETFIEQAVAKAHLVFYVNGTNKKPEVETAKIIRHYLRRDALVFAICNVRGKGDAYEFPEDRENLDVKGVLDAKKQTYEVLASALGEENLFGIESVQGLLAFCSLAVNEKGISTIHRSRKNDLIRAQNVFLKDFESIEAMRSFSKIEQILKVILSKLDTYKEDIIESNKKKLIRLISDNLDKLSEMHSNHRRLSEDIKIEFSNCKESINKSISFYKTSISNKRTLALNNLFTNIEDGVCEIIRNNFVKKNQIKRLVKELVENQKDSFSTKLANIHENSINYFNDQVNLAIKRLNENIQRVQFQHELSKLSLSDLSLTRALEVLEINMKEIGGALLNIGSYAFSGFVIGSAFPIIGNIVGGIVGAVVGILLTVLNYLGSKEKKIRKAQAKAIESIQDIKSQFVPNFNDETQKLIKDIENSISVNIFEVYRIEISKMEDVLILLESQIKNITNVKKELEEKSYGSL